MTTASSLTQKLHEFVMEQPCAQERHDPFVIAEETSERGNMIYGYVRTSSSQLDGCGGRTDVHDVFSLLWACVMRAAGAASPILFNEGGFVGIEEEIYARWLVFQQIGDFNDNTTAKQRLLAHAAHAFHVLDEVLGWADIKYPNAKWKDQEGEGDELAGLLNAAGEFSDFGDMAGKRECPDWFYAKSHKGRISVAVLPVESMIALRGALLAYEPLSTEERSRISILAGGLKNAIPKRVVSKGLRYIRAVENGDPQLPWRGVSSSPGEAAIIAIPLESHCVFLGGQTLVAVEGDCGLRQFEAERTKFLERRAKENAVFAADYIFQWPQKIDGSKFEDLIYSLLEREPGVTWVRQASPTNERDGGRDFIARWVVPVGDGMHEESATPETGVPTPAKALNVVVQVKARNPSVGKSKVQDIRDTVEVHDATGYFLVAFPQPANSLVEHLAALAKRGIWTDWWDRAQIETRLRKHVDLVARFADLVKVESRQP